MAFLSVVGTAISALGAIQSGMAASANANYQAQVANNNAIIARQNAIYATQAGQAQAAAQGLKNADLIGRAMAAQSANGIDVNSGSAVDVRTSQRVMGLYDTQNTLQNALLQAYGYRTQETSFTAQSQLDKAQADQAETAGFIKAAGGLLSSASSLPISGLGG